MDVRLNSWAYVAPVLDRESILVIAELDRAAQVAVCGPDSPGPLRQTLYRSEPATALH